MRTERTLQALQEVVIVALLLGSAGIARAQLACTANVGAASSLRSEVLTELVGDLVVVCTGGTPTALGALVPRVNVTVYVNSSVTSRLLGGSTSASEALLLVDEPAPVSQSPCASSTGCSILGTGTGAGTYSGAFGRPNVFQGVVSANSVTWQGVPLDPPAVSATRVLRLTNMRVNASAIPPGPGGTPGQVIAFVAIPSVPLTNPQQIVGYVVGPSLAASVRNATSTGPLLSAVALLQCAGVTPLKVATLRFSETLATAFKKRNTATSFGSPTATTSQNNLTIGTYNTETGFFNAAFAGNVDSAGLADFGTRLKAVFHDVPAGVALFVDINGTSVAGAAQNTARLTGSEAGAFVAVAESGGPPGTAQLPLGNGTGVAVWEVTDATPLAHTSLEFGVYLSYTANPAGHLPALGTAGINGSYAPVSPVGTASAGPIPRFVDTSTNTDVFTVTSCLTAGPSGTPNPVAPHHAVSLSVTAASALGPAVGYQWTATCPGLPSNGRFSDATARTPVWTPPHVLGARGRSHDCTIQVTVSGQGLSWTASYTQTVAAPGGPPAARGGPMGGPGHRGPAPSSGDALAPTRLLASPLALAGRPSLALGHLGGQPEPVLVVGPGPGGEPRVRSFRADGTDVGVSFLAYEPAFAGGVRVASCDLDGDGDDEVVTAPGPGGGPHVKVWKVSGTTASVVAEFLAYDPTFRGGVFVACGDLSGEGRPEIVTGAGEGGGPHVRVWRLDGPSVTEVVGFFAYDPGFHGGVRVAMGDLRGEGHADLVTAAGPGGGPHVRVFDGASLAQGRLVERASFLADDSSVTSGVYVAAVDLDADGHAEVITATGDPTAPTIRAFEPLIRDARVRPR